MRLILVLILLYVLLRTFMNYILPYMIKGAVYDAEQEARRKKQKNMKGTHISHIPPKKDNSYNGGEYVDYEEVK